MAKKRTLQSKISSFLYNHIWLKMTLEYMATLFATIISAVLFAFGICVFCSPSNPELGSFVTGGASGAAQRK